MTNFASIMKKCFPMHIRGPAEKGRKEEDLLLLIASGENLSGLKLRGSGQCFSDLWMVSIGKINLVPENKRDYN